ncbi:MAG: hypothetical protein IJB76_00060 [Clostridia bacterium]|nr:hypothetical protein [Clostridia bacterium]MBQ4647539.1 hypothetical protein [Clostridia bacterium]
MLNKKTTKVAGDLIYTVMATVVMNVVLQFIVYPLITKHYGEDVTGSILYFIGVIYVVPQALGTAISNARLVLRKNTDIDNSDITGIIGISSALTAVICGIIGFIDNKDPVFAVAFGLFSVIYLLRAYAQVDFRLSLKFKGYFIYYCIISVGYLIGLGLYFLTDIWLLIFITGEAMALAYTFFKGNIFKKSEKHDLKGTLYKSFTMLAFSTLIRDLVLQFDKVMLKASVGEAAVTQYHTVSLIAKTMQMLIQPINTLILSYLTVKGAVLSKKNLLRFSIAALGFGAVFYGLSVVGTPIYLKLFYPDMYSTVIGYNFIVNLGLILGFIASLFMALILSQGKTALHTAIEIAFGAVYAVAAYFFINSDGIWGLAYVTLAVNAVKLIFSIGCLFAQYIKQSAVKEEQ